MKLPSLFISKRFWSAVVGLVFMVIGAYVPEIADKTELYEEAVLLFFGTIIGTMGVQDAISASRGVNKYNG